MTSRQGRRCVRNDERGSAVLGLGLCGLVVLLAIGVGILGALVSAYVAASTAADAAALAAAPVTFAPFGAAGSAADEAARFARLNGATLVRCACAPDPSFASRTVTVQVQRTVRFPVVGPIAVRAASRATFEPARLIP